MMSQGTANGQRVGNRINNLSCDIRIHVDIDSTTNAFTNQIELWVVWFDEWGGADVATYDPGDNTSPHCLIETNIWATVPDATNTVMRYWYTRKNMRVLKHKFWVMGNATYSIAAPYSNSYRCSLNKHMHIRLKGRKTYYKGNTGVSTDIQRGLLAFIFKWSRDGVNTSNPPNLTASYRLKYQDA